MNDLTLEQKLWHMEKRLKELEAATKSKESGWERMTLRDDDPKIDMPPYPEDSLWDRKIKDW